MPLPPAARLRPGPRALAGAGLGIAAIAAAIALLGGGEGEPASAQGGGESTVPLERRDLVARESVDGTLGFAGEAEVINRLPGTVTWLPAEGDVIGRGGRLHEIDGEPVILMYGNVPAYRALAEGIADGPDVRQLESNLAELGFGTVDVDDRFTAATANAVADWQRSLDLEATGEVELGRVAFLSGARRVTSLELALGADAGSAAGASGAAGAKVDSSAAASTPVAYAATSQEQADPEPEDTAEAPSGQPSKPGVGKGKKGAGKQPREQALADSGTGEARESGAAGAGDASAEGSGASAANPSTPVMTTSSERRVVTVELDPADAGLAKRGKGARVELPDGKEVKGRVASVGTVAGSSGDDAAAQGEDSSADPTIEVTISLPEGARASGLDQAPVTVELTEEVRRDVLAVPVEALLGTAGGEFAIVVRDPEGSRRLPVSPGLFADGYVEVEGEGLSEGLAVEVPGQ